MSTPRSSAASGDRSANIDGFKPVDRWPRRENAAAVARIDARQRDVDRLAASPMKRALAAMMTPAASRLSWRCAPGATQITPLWHVAQRDAWRCSTSTVSSWPSSEWSLGSASSCSTSRIDDLALGVASSDRRRRGAACRPRGRCRPRWSAARSTIEVGSSMPLDDAARIEGERDAWAPWRSPGAGVGQAQAGEDQPHRLAEAAPFQRRCGRHRTRMSLPGDVELARRSAASGSRGRPGRPSGAARRPPARPRPGRRRCRPPRARKPDKFS